MSLLPPRLVRAALILLLSAPAAILAQAPTPASTTVTKASTAVGILSKDEAGTLMPATVFFRGQTAPVQTRNAAGIRFAPDMLLLTSLVDTSGYSTSVKQRYQAYLLTELPLTLAGHTLAPGAYGFGFIANDTFLVMDVGGHELFTAHSTPDAAMRRPTPLQILPDTAAQGSFRLYAGRSYVSLSPTSGT